MMADELDSALLDRYFAGECTPAERAVVDQLLASPAAAWRVRVLQEGLSAIPPQIGRRSAQQALADFWWEMESARRPRSGQSTGARQGYGQWRWSALGVFVAVVTGIVVFGRAGQQRIGPSTAQVYRTRVGERLTITRRGARITLAPQTTLTFTGSTVRLSGEAYFEISQRTAAPFVVQTGAVATRVLGTAFDVRQYPNDAEVRVAVTEGKVAIVPASSRYTAATVTAGNVARANDSTVTITDVRNVAEYAQWTSGRLAFHDMPVPEVLRTIGRWYGYEFHLIDSSLVHERVTVAFDGHSGGEVLRSLKRLLDVDMVFDGTKVTLRGKALVPPIRPRNGMSDSFSHQEVGR